MADRGGSDGPAPIGMCQKFAGYTACECRSASFVVNFATDQIPLGNPWS